MKRVAVLSAVLLFASCAGFTGTDDVAGPPMDGTIWMLKHIGNTDVENSATQPFIKFDSGTFQGFGGCNRFTGGYTVEKDRLRIKQITATKMFCPEISIEQDFLSNLQRGTRFMIKTDKLLIAEGDKPVLLFKAKQP